MVFNVLRVALVAPILLGAEAVILYSQPNSTKPSLRANATSGVVNMAAAKKAPPCACEPTNPAWVAPTRTAPKCIFIDLGAADGNTFRSFLANGYGPVANCPSGGAWQAILVEANPLFQSALQKIQSDYMGSVTAMGSHAAYDCEGQTSFFVDTVNHAKNYWGSSMSPEAPDAKASGHQQVTVPTLNLNRLIYENTIAGDWVMVKMDIEGAEWDVMPCLAASPAAPLVDRLFMEVHSSALSLQGKAEADMEMAKNTLRSKGVDIPYYNTPHSA